MSFFGSNIKKIRSIKKLSQSGFAEIFDITRASIGAYEEGRAEPKVDVIIRIANHFGLSVDQLVSKELTVNELYHFDIFREDISGKEHTKHNLLVKPEVTSHIPYITSASVAAYLANHTDQDFIKSLPYILVPDLSGTSLRAYKHEGLEMYYNNIGIAPGDIVLGNIIAKKELTADRVGHLFVILTKSGTFVRRLGAFDKTLTFSCDNNSYKSLQVKGNEIEEIWEVTGTISSNLQRP